MNPQVQRIQRVQGVQRTQGIQRYWFFFLGLGLLFLPLSQAWAQPVDSLDLLDDSDINILLEKDQDEQFPSGELNLSEFEEVDDLESLKNDIGETLFNKEKKKTQAKVKEKIQALTGEKSEQEGVKTQGKSGVKKGKIKIFDVDEESRKLIEMAKLVEGKIPAKEWDQIAASAQVDKYIVQKGDWLWKISQKLFGSGFYYSKVWSLNPYITNPHEIEPGMTLVFSTGDFDEMPNVKVSSFQESTPLGKGRKQERGESELDLSRFGDNVDARWLRERKKLMDQGVYFQYASDETLEDIKKITQKNLNEEYKKYDPPLGDDKGPVEPGIEYDDTGFDKNSRIVFNVKEGFFLNTFITSNIVQDLGKVEGMRKENVFIQPFDKIYVKFDRSVNVKPGDMYSIYTPGGVVAHKISDRSGYKYTIGAQIKALRKINAKWECLVTELSGLVQREDRVTIHTPKIGKIIRTFSKRNIEAAMIGAYRGMGNLVSLGDVIYLDRGRADGVEMGTVFEFYSFFDKGTNKLLSLDPTYKIGEVAVISLTDNFSTALVMESSEPIPMGSVALSKTEEQALLEKNLKRGKILKGVKDLEQSALDELDISLNLDDISEELLEKADKVELTEDELRELERQERKHSVIQDHERDLKELERLESELEETQGQLEEGKVDEDKFLEQQNLNQMEEHIKDQDSNAFESLNDIEEEIGVRFMDEELNSQENPYGLSEFDLEEIDELLNLEE